MRIARIWDPDVRLGLLLGRKSRWGGGLHAIVPVVPSSKMVVVGKAVLFSTQGLQTYLLIGGCSPPPMNEQSVTLAIIFPKNRD